MPSAQPAACLGSLTTHTGAMPGLMIGAAGGALLLGAAILTGGAAVILLGIAAGAGTALGGEYIGAAMTSPSGAIATGSMNVFVAGLPAARAVLDLSAGCVVPPSPHPPSPIATGAATVFINGMPAARHGGQLPCGGAIQAVDAHVYIGGATVTLIPVRPEVPPAVNRVLEVVMVVSLVTGVGAAMLTAAAAVAGAVTATEAVLTGLGVGIRPTAGIVLANRIAHDAGVVARARGATEAQARVAEQVAALLASHATSGLGEPSGEMGVTRPGGQHPFPGRRLPVSGGAWDGPEGNSTWYPGATEGPGEVAVRDADGNVIQDPNNPVVQAIGNRGVPFANGEVDFDGISTLANVPIEMTGNSSADFRAADAQLARQLGSAWTASDVEDFRYDNGLTWHHSVDGETMQLVPKILNSGVSHTGGASLARGQ